MILEELSTKGTLSIKLYDAQGNLKDEKLEKNLVVTVGRNWIAGRLKDTGTPNQMTHMEIGQGTITPATTDVAIQIPFSPAARVAVDNAGGTVLNHQITYSATFPASTGTGAVTEAAIFNASSSGTMLCRTTFGVINKAVGDVLVIQWVISILAS